MAKWKIGNFWEKWQAYSLTFWPKLGVLRHFLVARVRILRKCKIGNFWEKWQAYSLTFWPKLGILRQFVICGAYSLKFEKVEIWQFWIARGSLRKWKIGNFWEKWQAYSLTFWPKLGVLRHFLICGGRSKKFKIGNFWEKWQAYSLTFWPKLGVLRHFLICGSWSLRKCQAYSLTFWPKLGVLRHFLIARGSLRKWKIGNFWQFLGLFGQNGPKPYFLGKFGNFWPKMASL